MIKAYFDRNPQNVEGFFTLVEIEGLEVKPLFQRLPARSGQAGYTKTDWVRGKSPIPYGKHLLWLSPLDTGKFADYNGIGEFYPISNREGSKRMIWTEKPSSSFLGVRQDIGLHPENKYPGSAGCIVLLVDTPERKQRVTDLFNYLREQGKSQKKIALEVL